MAAMRATGVRFHEHEYDALDAEIERLRTVQPRINWTRSAVIRDLALRELQAVERRTARAKSDNRAA